MSKQLLLFVDVVQQGTFAKAAALHEMDNSLLSKQIKRLEADLGVQLLNRSTRSFSLTSAGEDIFQKSLKLRELLGDIQLTADAYQAQPKGLLRITAPTYFGQQYLQPVISEFMRSYPEVQITCSLDDRKSDIISEHYDIAFRLSKLNDSSLIAQKIANSHFILVASPDFIAKHQPIDSLQTLLSLPAVIYSNRRVTLDNLLIRHPAEQSHFTHYKMQGRYRVNDVRTLLEAVTDGLGYARIDASNLNQPLKQMGLQQLLPDYTISTADTAIYAIYPHRKQTRLVKEFILAVKNHIGDPPYWLQYLE